MKKLFFSKILVFGLLAIFLATPISAGATVTADNYDNYSVEQLEALIAKLQKKLLEVKSKSKCFITEKNLSLGDGEAGENTEEVRRLQNFLAEKGYFKYKATGYFGKITLAALKAYQRAQDVVETGEFDDATRAKAHSSYCKTLKAVKKEIKNETSSVVTSIVLKDEGSAKVSWVTTGKSESGFKVVWSKNTGPTYPTREGDKYLYLSESSAISATLDAFSGAGEYFVRVCEYLGGKCGIYSNEITINL